MLKHDPSYLYRAQSYCLICIFILHVCHFPPLLYSFICFLSSSSSHQRMKETLDLLLRRGADPNASSVPMPVVFFAIKSADVEMVQQLLMKGADTNTMLSADVMMNIHSIH